jgi:D-3-phosphoglycerate dehydrogenase
VLLHEDDEALDAAALVAAAKDADIIVADRKTEGRGEIFGKLPKLRAFVRCAVDIRNIDVEAATKRGILVTQASPGFKKSVSEMAIGYMIDLSRHISRATADYHADKMPEIVMGRQLYGSTAGIMGYGSIGRHLAPILKAIGMSVLVADPYAKIQDPDLKHVPFEELLAKSDYVVCLVVATEETENLMNAAAFARMRPHAVFINLSRGNLVDEAARGVNAPVWGVAMTFGCLAIILDGIWSGSRPTSSAAPAMVRASRAARPDPLRLRQKLISRPLASRPMRRGHR